MLNLVRCLALGLALVPLAAPSALAQSGTQQPTPAKPETKPNPKPEPKPRPSPEPGRDRAPACVIVKVTAPPRDGTGDIWDWKINGNPEPDIVIIEKTTGAQVRCDDSFVCQLVVNPVSSTLQLEIFDYDRFSPNQPMGEGSCKVGATCTFPLAKVTQSPC